MLQPYFQFSRYNSCWQLVSVKLHEFINRWKSNEIRLEGFPIFNTNGIQRKIIFSKKNSELNNILHWFGFIKPYILIIILEIIIYINLKNNYKL